MDLNRWLLQMSGGDWDNPDTLSWLIWDEDVRGVVLDYLQYYLSTPNLIKYLGLKNYLRYNSLEKIDFSWGWKDPRNTFTLPLWRLLFPDARVIHIRRHGVDVASSLRYRAQNQLSNAIERYKRKRIFYNLAPKAGGFTHSCRCLNLMGGFSLWVDYLKQAQKQVRAMGCNAMEVRYEDILVDPEPELSRIADFCGIRCDPARIRKAMRRVNLSRAYAYVKDPYLSDFAQAQQDKLSCFGY